MSRTLTVLSAQVAPVPWDPPATVDKFEDHVRVARRAFPDVDLMIFPELYLTAVDGFTSGGTGDWERRVAEEIPGPLTDRVGKIAARAKRWIIAGSINERRGRRFHNTAIAFSPDGELAAVYRKLFPWRPYESVDPGADPAPVLRIPGKGGVGLMICYDGWFPEVARGLALGGADLIAQPSATTTPDREEEVVLARANAIVNQVYLFNPNMISTLGPGRSVGVDPEGRVLFEGGGREELFVEVIDLERVEEIRRRGTRGITRPFQHFLDGPRDAVLKPYRARRTT
ncbi:MAG TPA: carbon-nitrogen hydrolase family protein [Actinomycetota bacterium]|nr:carbon-nitrogen hydrolase family protein [Actinomycetota bacterium]